MNSPPSALAKVQQRFWEGRRALRTTLGGREDACLAASDAELDSKLELLLAADESFASLLAATADYQRRLRGLMDAEDGFGMALHGFGLKDTSEAGKLMCHIGKALNCASRQKDPLRVPLVKLHHDVEIFQGRAVADAYDTVQRMEKARRSYRSALVWMQKASEELDPEVPKKLRKFRKVQDHVKNLKIRFDRLKLETMHKIDLLLFSRCNLFSQTLVLYQTAFCKMSKHVASALDSVVVTVPYYRHYTFKAAKELNAYSKNLVSSASNKILVPTRRKTSMKPLESWNDMDGDRIDAQEENSGKKVSICKKMGSEKQENGSVFTDQYKELSLIDLEHAASGVPTRTSRQVKELRKIPVKSESTTNEFAMNQKNLAMLFESGGSNNVKFCIENPREDWSWRKDLDEQFRSTLKLFDPLFENDLLQLEEEELESGSKVLLDFTSNAPEYQPGSFNCSFFENEVRQTNDFISRTSFDCTPISAAQDPFESIFTKSGENC